MFILDIFEKLIKKEPKVRLILIGDGEDRTKLEKEIDKKKLNKYVHMAGIQKDICGWLSTFDLFLFPSNLRPQHGCDGSSGKWSTYVSI